MRRLRVLLPSLAALALVAHGASQVPDSPERAQEKAEKAQAEDLAAEQEQESQSASSEGAGAGPGAVADAEQGKESGGSQELEPGTAVTRRAPPLETVKSLPPQLDLVGRALPGPDGHLRVETPEGSRTLTLDPELQR